MGAVGRLPPNACRIERHVPRTVCARQDAPSEAGMLLTSSSVIDPSKRIISTSCRIMSQSPSDGTRAQLQMVLQAKLVAGEAQGRQHTVHTEAAAERSQQHRQREASIASCERRGTSVLQRAPA